MNDEYLSLPEATKVIPGSPSYPSVHRWVTRGIKTRCGKRIRLEVRQFGRSYYTTRLWIKEFGKKLANRNLKHIKATGYAIGPRKGSKIKRERLDPDEDREVRQYLDHLTAEEKLIAEGF